MLTVEQYRDRAFDAMCVWEGLLERYQIEIDPALTDYWERTGTVAMRYVAIELSEWIYNEWERMPDDIRDGWSFDWEFVPEAVALVDWSGNAYSIPTDATERLKHIFKDRT